METRVKAPMSVIEIQERNSRMFKVEAQVDFISPQYSVNNISVPKVLVSALKEIDGRDFKEGETYECIFERGNVKQSQDGTAKDGDKTWDYFWDVAEFVMGAGGASGNDDLPWGNSTSYADKDLAQTPVAKPAFDATAGQRMTQHGLNVRTALMQAREAATVENGALVDAWSVIFEDADEILGYLTSRVFTDSPLATKAVNEGAVVKEVIDKPKMTLQENPRTLQLDSNWIIPERIINGTEFKKAAQQNGLEMHWIMDKFKVMNLAKSSDYVSEERGSYMDLFKLILNAAQNDGVGIASAEEI